MIKNSLNKITNTNILILCQTTKKLGIDYEILDWDKYKIRLKKGNKTHLITKKSLGLNSTKGIAISRDKHQTYQTLKLHGLPVLPQIKVKDLADYQRQFKQIPFPQVIKPVYGEKGRNIYLNVKTKTEGKIILSKLFKLSPFVVIEPYFPNAQDFRFIVLNYQVIGLSQRIPPAITGNRQHTIQQLIHQENQRRLKLNKKLGQRMLNRLLIWDRIEWYINQQGLKLTDTLPKNQTIIVYPIPNFSTGGQVKTIALNNIHPSFLKMSIKTAQAIGLIIIGIDVLIKDIAQPAVQNNCAIIEVNSDPGLRLHEWPNQGKPQKVTEKILKFIFP
ncbi:hypothetical protein KKD62_00500 [Patescibacteria group bacterium]|nr:hypothetical protein [Patescibacteria group bacterium]MBU1931358.1 hypothetical protein [Patescibacteria group bacterium]